MYVCMYIDVYTFAYFFYEMHIEYLISIYILIASWVKIEKNDIVLCGRP
jgi:hypothetical protein